MEIKQMVEKFNQISAATDLAVISMREFVATLVNELHILQKEKEDLLKQTEEK